LTRLCNFQAHLLARYLEGASQSVFYFYLVGKEAATRLLAGVLARLPREYSQSPSIDLKLFGREYRSL
jgi:hypothetical protein